MGRMLFHFNLVLCLYL